MSIMPCNEVFTQLLTHIFRNPNEDITLRHPPDSHDQELMPLKNRIVQSFNADCVKLIDKNGLSILGYIFLTNKYSALINLYYVIKDNDELCQYIARSLNSELKFVLTHRVGPLTSERQYLKDFITHLTSVKKYCTNFQLDVENAKLFGYRLAKVELNTLFTFPDDIIPFDVPTTFVPRIAPPPGLPPPLITQQYAPPPHQQYAPPPSPPPLYAPPPQYAPPPGPPPQHYAPPPRYAPRPPSTPPPPITYPPQQHAPPPQYQVHQVPVSERSYFGGTRKTHKRHKKQIRKHASKKNQA